MRLNIMGKRSDCSIEKVRQIPDGEPFVIHSREFLGSDAMRDLGINERRLLDFLEIEHMNHAGQENGNLIATYKQLEAFGINRRYIPKAIERLERRGLIRVDRGARKSLNESFPNRFALTYLIAKKYYPESNTCSYLTPSDEWKRYKNKSQ